MDMDTAEIAKISKALTDPSRLQIYQFIAAQPDMYCGQIIEKYRLTPATISHHLRVLTEAGLIECRREGQFVYTHPVPDTMQRYTQALGRIAVRGRRRRKSG